MSWIEQRLADLAADGYFDDLPGTGQPIADLGVQYSRQYQSAARFQHGGPPGGLNATQSARTWRPFGVASGQTLPLPPGCPAANRVSGCRASATQYGESTGYWTRISSCPNWTSTRS